MKNITLLQELYHLEETYVSDSELKIPDYMVDVLNNEENRILFNTIKYQNNVLFTFSQSPKIDITLTKEQKYLTIHALDYSIGRITFYAKLEFGKINPNDYNLKTHTKYSDLSYVTVKNVYRDRNFKNTEGLPEKIYLDFIINEYETLFSDHTQTNLGKKYWLKLIPEFFARHLNVYAFYYGDPDMPSAPLQYPKAYTSTHYNHGDAIKFSNPIEFKSFLVDNHIWGDTNSEYQNIRIVVTKHKLF
jgi:hypothetical protein